MHARRSTRIHSRLPAADSGTAMIEFVAVLPLLVTFLLLMIGVGQMLWYHHVVTQGVRDGVRYLSRAPLDVVYIDNARRMALTGTPDGSAPAYAFWTDPESVTVTSDAVNHGGAFAGPDPLIMVRMTASVPVQIPVLAYFDIGPVVTLMASDEARHIGE